MIEVFGPSVQNSVSSQITNNIINALQDQGHLFVPPAYYQVSSDQAVQLDSANDWIASKIIPECDFELSAIAWYVTAVVTQGDMAIELYSHDATNNQPNASLAVLVAASDSGDTADQWIQEELGTAQQLYAGKTYWIVGKGTAGDDYSCSTRRWNTAEGSMFPDTMPETKVSTDGGSTWSAAEQDSKPALWNIILNPNEDGVPQLAFGRVTGKYAIATTGLIEIPEGATFLDVSGDTADTLYYVYMDTDGSISTSTTIWTKSNGLMVKTGDITKKLIGMVYPQDILGGGDQAPTDIMDLRLVSYPGMFKTWGKRCPYSSTTADTDAGQIAWRQWMDNDDYKITGICNAAFLQAKTMVANSGYKAIGFGWNSTSPDERSTIVGNYQNITPMDTEIVINDFEVGVNYSYPLLKTETNGNGIRLYEDSSAYIRASINGWLWWK